MGTIVRFEEIESWQSARELVRAIYALTRSVPFSQDRGLFDQIQRAAISVMSNIAEGFESGSNAQFIRYLGYDRASAAEVHSQLYIALDQTYISKKDFDRVYALAEQTARQIGGFIRYLRQHPKRIHDQTVDYQP